MLEHVSGSITITKLPEGEAPQWVRAAWVGLVVPVIAISYTEAFGLLSKSQLGPRLMYIVPQREAIKALKKKSKRAATWWTSIGFPRPQETFGFNFDEASIEGKITCERPEKIYQFFGLLEVGVGAYDHPANN